MTAFPRKTYATYREHRSLNVKSVVSITKHHLLSHEFLLCPPKTRIYVDDIYKEHRISI